MEINGIKIVGWTKTGLPFSENGTVFPYICPFEQIRLHADLQMMESKLQEIVDCNRRTILIQKVRQLYADKARLLEEKNILDAEAIEVDNAVKIAQLNLKLVRENYS
jgi:hypothetical protein